MAVAIYRAKEAWQILRDGGPRQMAQRVSRVAYQRLGASDLEFPLDLDDVADSHSLNLAVPVQRPPRGTPLSVGWICSPPGPGSGGHTTLFRMVEAVEAAGHACVLYLYDRFHGELSRHQQVIRKHWPRLRAEIRSVATGLEPLDAYVASGWQTAHILAARGDLPTRRLYLVQDYEPYFYPRGTEYALAEDTYRFGFRCIAIGWMVASLLEEKFGIHAPVAKYGCDTSIYELTNPDDRSGVVFFARPRVARRGFELGVLALQEFHRHHPEQDIHIFGDTSAEVPFPAIQHGGLTPQRLSELYNKCRAGLTMSFTNVSLAPAEMIACGVIPVIGNLRCTQADLDTPHARWINPTPRALATELCSVMEATEPSPTDVAASIRAMSWDSAQRVFLETLEDEVYEARVDS
jgi:WsaF, C-terminal domain/WsaF, N-terminal domain